MSREYVINAYDITVPSAISTLIFLNPPATGPSIEIIRLWAGQIDSVTSAQVPIQLVTQVTAFPTLTTYTPRKLKFSDPVSAIVGGTAGAAGTCGINASVEGAGTKSVVMSWSFNIVAGFQWIPTPNETFIINAGASSGVGLIFPEAPPSLSGWVVGMAYRELG